MARHTDIDAKINLNNSSDRNLESNYDFFFSQNLGDIDVRKCWGLETTKFHGQLQCVA